MCRNKYSKEIAELERRIEMITNVNKHLVEKVKELEKELTNTWKRWKNDK